MNRPVHRVLLAVVTLALALPTNASASANDRPAWKWAAFGTSAGVFALALPTTIALGIQTGRGGVYRRRLVDAANASLHDTSPTNDVDPNGAYDPCAYASEEIAAPNGPPGVRNAPVTIACRRMDAASNALEGMAVITAISGASTLVFTAILFAGRDRRGVAALRRRGASLAVAPSAGGWSVNASMRF